MKTFSYHIDAVITTFKTLKKGRFLVFFIPGLLIMLLYIYITYDSEPEKLEEGVFAWMYEKFQYLFSFIVKQIYLFLILVLLSPVMSILSENFDSYLTGKEYKFNFVKLINDIIRAVFVLFIALIIEFSILLLLFMFGLLIPDFLDPFINFAVASFFFGFSFYDYSLERYSVATFGSIGFAFSKPITMILTGAVFSAIMLIPYVGIPIAPVLTVMISTVVYIKIKGVEMNPDGFDKTAKQEENNTTTEDQKTIEN